MQNPKIPLLTQRLSARDDTLDNIPILRRRVEPHDVFRKNKTPLPAAKIQSKKENEHPLILFLREAQHYRDVYGNPNHPLPKNLPTVLQRTAKLIETLQTSNHNLQTDRAVKLVHAVAKILRYILHPRTANNYRVLGLNENASLTQVTQHYQWLRRIFLFGEDNSAFGQSVLRIRDAYATLRSEPKTSKQVAKEFDKSSPPELLHLLEKPARVTNSYHIRKKSIYWKKQRRKSFPGNISVV